MPRPTSATTIQRPDLGVLAIEYGENTADFIGTKILTPFDVAEQAGDFPVIPVEALLNLPDTKRAARGKYNRDDYEFETDNYSCVENGLEEPVDDVERKLYARFFDAERVAMMRALKTILRVQEKRISAMLFNASNFTAHGVTNEWDDNSNATPIDDVNAGKLAIQAATGLEPDTLVVAYSTFLDLGLVSQIVDRIKYTHPDVRRGELSAALLAEALGVKQVLVGKGNYNTAKKGQAASLSPIWYNEYAMLCCTAPSAQTDIIEPCVGRTFRWSADDPGMAVESYRDETVRGDIIRARQFTDEELINTASAYLFSNITTI